LPSLKLNYFDWIDLIDLNSYLETIKIWYNGKPGLDSLTGLMDSWTESMSPRMGPWTRGLDPWTPF